MSPDNPDILSACCNLPMKWADCDKVYVRGEFPVGEENAYLGQPHEECYLLVCPCGKKQYRDCEAQSE